MDHAIEADVMSEFSEALPAGDALRRIFAAPVVGLLAHYDPLSLSGALLFEKYVSHIGCTFWPVAI